MTKWIGYEVLDWLKDKKGTLLDAGSGNDFWVNQFKSIGLDAIGCDKVEFENIDKVDLEGLLPYDDGRFDFVTAIEVIEHIENYPSMIKEFNRVLKPEGRLLLTTPNITRFRSRLQFLLTGHFWCFGSESMKSGGHISPMTYDQIKMLLERKGFSIEEVRKKDSLFVVARKVKI
jgi:cyclopropane fatty-acyl-phospholipid synthase-like methyltransferase